MQNNQVKFKGSSLERKALIAILIVFVGVLATAWMYATHVRQTIASNTAGVNVDARALIEVEKLRNIAESQIANSRAYFLLGSKSLYDAQKSDKQNLTEGLANFEKQFNLPQIPEIVKRINTLEDQNQEFFDQGMKFREQQTESKIVGQFYQSKASPILVNINKALDEIVALHNAELEKSREKAKEAASNADTLIPRGMIWLTWFTSVLFAGLALLIIRMLLERSRQLAERSRLYEEAKKAVQSRDEVVVAISQDLKEPLAAIYQTAESLKTNIDPTIVRDSAEFIQSSVSVAESQIKDIMDQSKADDGTMTLRLDQLGIDGILEEAKIMLQPLAKQRDVRLQIDTVNPPVLAFFDRERVMRVLSNLMGNAIKFSPRSSKVTVKVKSDQAFVYITVMDEGPGIPEKHLAGLFEHFWQARKTADQGPGIGLAVVKTIVEAHGGAVSVDSHVGHGSKFTFSLPRRRPAGAQLGRTTPNVRMITKPQPDAQA